MMGQHDRSEALFYYFRLEDQVPDNHLLRLIDKHISFESLRRKKPGAPSLRHQSAQWEPRPIQLGIFSESDRHD